MKGSRLYLLILFSFLIIVFIMQLMAPHKFVWKPTYDKYDKEPFGSYVFDDVLSSSIDNYTVVNKTFYQLWQEDSMSSGRAFLLTEASPDFTDTDIGYMYKIVHLGNQAMICANYFPRKLEDTLRFSISQDRYFSIYRNFNVKDIMLNNIRDSIFFGTDTLNPVQIYAVFPQFHPTSIIPGVNKKNNELKDSPDNDKEVDEVDEVDEVTNGDSAATKISIFYPMICDSSETLVWGNGNKPLAIRAFIGKGEIFIISNSLMFTNFGMLDGTNASYVFRLLSYMKEKPLIRIEAYGVHGDEPRSPLRYILSERPLRWATYAGMAFLLLFMAFSVKRRQRIIPVVITPQNGTLAFMQLISNLYYQKHDNIEILKMKYRYFCTDINNLIGIELYEQAPGEADYERMVEKTGMEKDFIGMLLHNIRLATYREEVDDLQLKQYIDGMNEILRALKN